jgi:hypothetical protein
VVDTEQEESMNVKQQALRLGQAIQGKAIAFPVKLVTDNDNDPNIEWFEDSNGDHVDPYTVMLALNAAYGTPQSSIGESGAAEYELLDAAVAFIERNAASVFALEGFDRLSMAIHNHPGAHIKVEDRASRSATGESVVEEARSMLHTCEHITRLTEGMHTYDTAFVLRLCRAIVAASDGNINK